MSSGSSDEVSFRAVNDIPVEALRPLLAADDQDAARAGTQVRVTLRHRGAAPPVLSVGDVVVEGTISGADEVVYEGVTLRQGENEILAVASSGAQATLRVAVREPRLEILIKADTLGCIQDDVDASTPGLQVLAVIRGYSLPEATPVTVSVAGRDFPAQLREGEAAVTVTLPSESSEVPILATARVVGQSISAQRSVSVQCAGCAIATVGGREPRGTGVPIAILGPADVEGDSDGFTAAVTVVQEGLPGTRVELLVDGGRVASATADEPGILRFSEVPFTDGSSLELRCTRGGVEELGRAQVLVDLKQPPPVTDLSCAPWGLWTICRWTEPEDTQSPTGLAAYSLRYRVEAALSEETFELGVAVPQVPAPYSTGTTLTAFFPVERAGECSASFALRAFDAAGNGSSLSNVAVVDFCGM